MKNLYLMFLVLLFTNCSKEESSFNFGANSSGCQKACGKWERCSNVSNDWSFNWQCVPMLRLYTNHGYWSGQLTIVDDLGNSYTQELLNLDALCANPTFYFNSETWKYMMLPFPLSESAFYSCNGIYPDDELNWLDLEFTDPISLEFIINDSIYDPFVESVVFYQGTGQIINTNGSADAILELNCQYLYEEHTYSVSFSATR
tara:strand:- start:7 stop:612 length:606 start_codon:yes stop_codon:yes gene_type:complete